MKEVNSWCLDSYAIPFCESETFNNEPRFICETVESWINVMRKLREHYEGKNNQLIKIGKNITLVEEKIPYYEKAWYKQRSH